MPYALDDRHDPLLSMHLHGWVSDAELDRMLADLDELIAREKPFAVVLDCSGLRVPEIRQVRRLAAWFGDNFEAAARCHRGISFVITTPMIRGTLRAIMQMQAMPMPVTVVETVEAGRRWAAQRLASGRINGSMRASPRASEL